MVLAPKKVLPKKKSDGTAEQAEQAEQKQE